MSKYPHKITIGLTDKLYKELLQEMSINVILGSISKTPSNIISMYILDYLQKNENGIMLLKSITED